MFNQLPLGIGIFAINMLNPFTPEIPGCPSTNQETAGSTTTATGPGGSTATGTIGIKWFTAEQETE